MDEPLEFAKLAIPSGYNEIIQDLVSKCQNSKFNRSVVSYSTVKQTLGLPQNISNVSRTNFQSKEFLPRQTVMLSQGEYLGKIAKEAPIEVKPILYHYAENSLFSFFVYSLFSFTPSHSFSHGMKIVWAPNVDDMEIQFSNTGFFPRLIDCYSLCRGETVFSPIKWNTQTQCFEESSHSFSLKNTPKIKLKDLIDYREKLGTNSEGYIYDIIDFVLLFVCSSLARYRPYIWNEIARGEKGTHVIWFNQCFSRFETVKKRLKQTILYLKKYGSPDGCPLCKFDFQP